MYFDHTFLLLLPAVILTLYAQTKSNSAYRKFSGLPNQRGCSGFRAARTILARGGNEQYGFAL
jgi:Zn-dependent membrane protease YugP